jgi:hypothetical protein
MLMSLDNRLRRNRRWAACAVAVLALGFVGLAAHSALMSSSMGNHTSDAAGICLAVGGCALFIGVALFTARRLLQRPTLLIASPLAPVLPFIPAFSGCLVRAGPPPLLQVFRL